MSLSGSNTIYIFDPNSNTFVPYKPDYSSGIPISDFEMVRQKQTARQREPIKDKNLGVIVPLIHTQPRQSDWAQLASIAQRYPRVNTIAVVSPSQDTRGIENFGPDAEFNNGIRFLQNASVQVLGYISTGEGRSLDSIRTEIDRWREWYPSVNGLFFDCIPNSSPGIEIQGLAAYAKVDRGFQLVVADLAFATSGGAVNRQDDFVDQMKGVDIFVIYERESYPADGWYPSMKKDWMAKHPRSKFAFIVNRVGTETLACRNFIDKCVGIEKIAGYVYVMPNEFPDDRRDMREWTNISPLTEICIDHLSQLALTEGIPSTKGVVPEQTVIDTSAGLEGGGRSSQSKEEHPEAIARQDIQFDKFGVRKIYPSAQQNLEWYLFEENPAADVNFKNLPDRLIRNADGSWTTNDKQVRLEAWSPKDRKFLNVEITGYFKALSLPKGQRYVVQQYARGGHHYKDIKKWCEGSAYKGRLLANGMVAVVKEIHHNAYTGNRGTTQATTKPLEKRWIGMKTVIYNYIKRGARGEEKTCVGMEIWIDDNVNDENGNLVVRNDWKPIMHMQDEGGWFASSDYSTKSGKGFRKNKCSKLDVNSKDKYRRKDEILTMPGGTDYRNACCFRWDEAKVAFKHLSVREIERLSPD